MKIVKDKIKKKSYGFFSLFNTSFFSILYSFLRVVNNIRKRKKLLIFTDSRGFEVTRPWNRRNPLSSYVRYLIFKYSCHVFICPETYTSLLDFLNEYEKLKKKGKSFDYVVLHCGIVDFAPRPLSSFDEMYDMKSKSIEEFSLSNYICRENRETAGEYQGEKTLSFLNEDALNNIVLPRLLEIDNLIYVGINPVLPNWDGIYWRKRPSNINDQLVLDGIMRSSLDKSLDLSGMIEKDIKIFTSDNVHYTKEGFDYIYSNLLKYLPTS